MTASQTRAAYNRFLDEAFNNGRIDKLGDLLTDDYAFHDAPPGTPPGREGVRQVVTMFRNAFPDLHVTIDDQIAEGDKVSSLTTTRGTHTGAEIFGVKPSGKSFAMKGMTMARVENGRVAESWVKNDVMSMMSQLGAAAPR